MAYKYTNQKGTDYYLHHSKNGPRTLYFFKREQGEGGLDEVPGGYTVSETGNGLPVLKKAGAEAASGKAGSNSKASGAEEAATASKASTGSKTGAGNDASAGSKTNTRSKASAGSETGTGEKATTGSRAKK